MADPQVYTDFITAMTARINSDPGTLNKPLLTADLIGLLAPLRAYVNPSAPTGPVVSTAAEQAATTNTATLSTQIFYRSDSNDPGTYTTLTGWDAAAAEVGLSLADFQAAISKGPVTQGTITISQFKPAAATKYGRPLLPSYL